MIQTYRAIYENGVLRLLDHVDLQEGQEVQVVVEAPESDPLRELLKGIVSHWPDPTLPRLPEEEAFFRELDEATQNGTSIAEMLDEEREDRF